MKIDFFGAPSAPITRHFILISNPERFLVAKYNFSQLSVKIIELFSSLNESIYNEAL